MVKTRRLKLSRRGQTVSRMGRKLRRRIGTRKKLGRLMKYGIASKRLLRRAKRRRVKNVKPLAMVIKKRSMKRKNRYMKSAYKKVYLKKSDYNSPGNFKIGFSYVNDELSTELIYNSKTFISNDFKYMLRQSNLRACRGINTEIPNQIFDDYRLQGQLDLNMNQIICHLNNTKFQIERPWGRSTDSSPGISYSFYQPLNITASTTQILSLIFGTKYTDFKFEVYDKILADTFVSVITYNPNPVPDANNNMVYYRIGVYSVLAILNNEVFTHAGNAIETNFRLWFRTTWYRDNKEILIRRYINRTAEKMRDMFVFYEDGVGGYDNKVYNVSNHFFNRDGSRRIIDDDDDWTGQRFVDYKTLIMADVDWPVFCQGHNLLYNPAVHNLVNMANTAIVQHAGYYVNSELGREFLGNRNYFLPRFYLNDETYTLIRKINTLGMFLNMDKQIQWRDFLTSYIMSIYNNGTAVLNPVPQNIRDLRDNKVIVGSFYFDLYIASTMNFNIAQVGEYDLMIANINDRVISVKPLKYGHNYKYVPRAESNCHIIIPSRYNTVRYNLSARLDLGPLKSILSAYNRIPDVEKEYKMNQNARNFFSRLKLMGDIRKKYLNRLTQY